VRTVRGAQGCVRTPHVFGTHTIHTRIDVLACFSSFLSHLQTCALCAPRGSNRLPEAPEPVHGARAPGAHRRTSASRHRTVDRSKTPIGWCRIARVEHTPTLTAITDHDQTFTLLHRPERVIKLHDPDPHRLRWTRATGIDQINIPGHGRHKIEICSKQQEASQFTLLMDAEPPPFSATAGCRAGTAEDAAAARLPRPAERLQRSGPRKALSCPRKRLSASRSARGRLASRNALRAAFGEVLTGPYWNSHVTVSVPCAPSR
jgi:hypothetical protein